MIESNEEQGVEYYLRKAGQLFRDVAGRAARAEHDVAHLREMLAKAREELATMLAERAPIDNGDGTETKLLPVTYPKGLDVVEVRRFRKGDWFATGIGKAVEATSTDTCPTGAWLILRPAPKPPEPVTWEAELADGMWHATNGGALAIRGNGQQLLQWEFAETYLREVRRPSVLGRYLFVNGVGTLIEEAKQ